MNQEVKVTTVSSATGRETSIEDTNRKDKLKKLKVLSCSGGGARVITSIIGGILAFEQIGMEFEVIVALSGSFPALGAWKHGNSGPVLARHAVEKKFVKLLRRETSIFGWLRAIVLRRVSERVFPETGIFGSEPLGHYLAKLIPEWPPGLVTGAVTSLYQKRSLILFTDKGVLEQKPDGWELLISQKEMVKNGRSMAEEAGRATGTIPGILTGFRCITPKRDLLLYDGVFSKEGPYLIDPIVDAKLFGYSKENILVFNVGEDEESWITKIQDLLYFLICRECYLPKSPDGHKQGVLAICPKIAEFSSVNFWVGEYAKLRALIKGYAATVETLNKEGLLTAQMFARAVKIIAEANALHRRTRWMKWCFLGKLRARKMKELLARHGMYDLGETS